MRKEILYVDGYNMIGAWPPLVRLKRQNKLEEARNALLDELSEYATYHRLDVRVVFDAMYVPGLGARYDQYALTVIFTREGETADEYIERVVGEENLYTTRVQVATSDLAEQWVIFQRGATRLSARDLWRDLQRTRADIESTTAHYNRRHARRLSPFSDGDHVRLRRFYEQLAEEDE